MFCRFFLREIHKIMALEVFGDGRISTIAAVIFAKRLIIAVEKHGERDTTDPPMTACDTTADVVRCAPRPDRRLRAAGDGGGLDEGQASRRSKGTSTQDAGVTSVSTADPGCHVGLVDRGMRCMRASRNCLASHRFVERGPISLGYLVIDTLGLD